MVTGDGAWNYLQWDAAQKKLMPLPTKSIQMVKMQEHIQELNELAQRTEMILRFKTEAHQCQSRDTNHPLVATGVDALQSPMGTLEPASAQQRLAVGPWPASSSPEPHQSSCGILGQKLERPILTMEAARATLSLRLTNPHGVTCYVNANLQAFIWGTLQRQDALWADFGASESAVQELLLPRFDPVYALGLPGFNPLYQAWGHFDRQADASEFLHRLLEWANPPHVDMTWTRRVEMPDCIQICDRGSTTMPPTLQPPECQKETTLQALITTWHEYQGMYTCFEVDAPMLGLQIDQFRPGYQGAFRTPLTLCLTDEVFLPFWSDAASVAVYHREYTPVAALLHAGRDQDGHIQSALLSPAGWHVTNDNQLANIDDPDLAERMEDIVFVWLVRSGVLRLSGVAQPQYDRDARVHQVMRYLHSNDLRGLQHADTLMHFLHSSCGACGCLYFDAETLTQHFKMCNPGLWLELRRTAQAMQTRFKCFTVPCGLCGTTAKWSLDPPEHTCMVAVNLAICQIYHTSVLRPMSNMFALDDQPHPDSCATSEALTSFAAWMAWENGN